MFNAADVDPFWPRRWRALHKEKLGMSAVRISLHHHCPLRKVREQGRSHIDVILNQVPLGDAQLGPEQLVQVGQFDNTIPNFYVHRGLGLWELYLWNRTAG